VERWWVIHRHPYVEVRWLLGHRSDLAGAGSCRRSGMVRHVPLRRLCERSEWSLPQLVQLSRSL